MPLIRLLFSVLFLAVLGGCQTAGLQEDPGDDMAALAAEKDQPYILGWVENVRIGDVEATVKGKLDSGARTSSIDAEIVRTFKRDDQDHVLFRVDFDGTEETFEAPITRWVRIRSRQEGETIRRPVIEMAFCLGGRKIMEEVNLAERSHFNYPVLIGRNMLARENILVDSSQTFQHAPSCDTVSSDESP